MTWITRELLIKLLIHCGTKRRVEFALTKAGKNKTPTKKPKTTTYQWRIRELFSVQLDLHHRKGEIVLVRLVTGSEKMTPDIP